jgi:hypothetical protein
MHGSRLTFLSCLIIAPAVAWAAGTSVSPPLPDPFTHIVTVPRFVVQEVTVVTDG